MANITFTPLDFNQTSLPDIPKYCFNWCKEQNFIHQQNLFIADLILIFIASLSLLIYIIIDSYSDEILANTKIHKDYLKTIEVMAIHFAFFMMIIFLIYMLKFK